MNSYCIFLWSPFRLATLSELFSPLFYSSTLCAWKCSEVLFSCPGAYILHNKYFLCCSTKCTKWENDHDILFIGKLFVDYKTAFTVCCQFCN